MEIKFPWKLSKRARFLEELKSYAYFVLPPSIVITFLLYLYLQKFGLPEFYHEILLFKEADHGVGWHYRHPGLLHIIPTVFGFFIALFGSLFALEEIFHYFARSSQEQIAIEKMQKEQAQLKAQVLKKQLNPHFMFNTLNVLSGLIHEDIDKSDQFIKELSEIYRYVLEHSEELLCTLEQEIHFINSYFYLLKIRFEDKLLYDIQIPDAKLKDKIPSLTLEILVENAIKHNIVSKESPLQIDIFIEDNKLIVQNNLQIRDDGVQSIGKGIPNLQGRLALIGIEGASFGIVENKYVASVPLVQ